MQFSVEYPMSPSAAAFSCSLTLRSFHELVCRYGADWFRPDHLEANSTKSRVPEDKAASWAPFKAPAQARSHLQLPLNYT